MVKAGGCVDIGVGTPYRIANLHDDDYGRQ